VSDVELIGISELDSNFRIALRVRREEVWNSIERNVS